MHTKYNRLNNINDDGSNNETIQIRNMTKKLAKNKSWYKNKFAFQRKTNSIAQHRTERKKEITIQKKLKINKLV